MGYKLKKNRANRKNYGGKRAASIIKYIVVHATMNDGDTDENNGKYFANNNLGVSANYFVDSDSVTQSVPDNYVAHAVGGGKYCNCDKIGGGTYYGKCTNDNSLSIELCDDKKNGKVYPSQETIDNAIALTKKKMKKYGIPQKNVIRHFDVNGKKCPDYWCGSDKKDQKWKKEFWDKLLDEKIEKKVAKYYDKYTGEDFRIDVVLEDIGVPVKYRGSIAARRPLAKANGITGTYKGTGVQNRKLINKAKKGKLKKV